ncbi:SDR family oxidoreductase [Actinomadura latina]|uniref:SDR family oxidoreductase n=1 Tax=Actinomadura latina TaxID=163603 RepID=A0A846YX90_9ACTN|nr:SDR family oxidoreductase [Actinomadura latina]
MAGTNDGRVAVVTGAARGLGALLARGLADRGMKVALLGLEPAELAETAAACGPDARHWEADVTDDAALARVASEIKAVYGRVDIVIANAGIATGGPVEYSDPRTFSRVIEVNLLGSVATARAFLPALRESKGYFFQVASLAALCPAPMMAAYCASKSGVEAFAHSLRAEVAHHGVRVGVGYLSWTDTDMVRGADQDAALAGMRAKLPFPTNRTYPLEPTVDRLVAGILRRRAHVYGQRWLPFLQGVRAFIPATVTRHARRHLADSESQWLAAGADTRLVGAGGAANETRDVA